MCDCEYHRNFSYVHCKYDALSNEMNKKLVGLTAGPFTSEHRTFAPEPHNGRERSREQHEEV